MHGEDNAPLPSGVKQVIVIRKDLKMRRGKEIAQGAHASMAWLTRKLRPLASTPDQWTGSKYVAWLTAEQQAWVEGAFTKVCVVVDTEEELRAVYEKAYAAGIEAHLITDAGRTEFGGVPTVTACGIGPDTAERLDPITGHLKLY